MISHFCDWLARRVTICATALAVLFVPTAAIAQTITVATTPPEREPGPEGHDEQTSISAADCRANDEFRYRVTTQGVGGESLEVWVGTGDCTAREARVGLTRSCWLARRESTVINEVRFIPLKAQDIVSRNLQAEDEGGGSLAGCNQNLGVSQAEKHTLFFMLVNSNLDLVGTAATTDVLIDLVGPQPPTQVRAGVGENRIVLRWKGSEARDLLGYSFYCDPPRGAMTTMQADAALDVGPLDDGGLDDGAPDGTGGASGAAGDSGMTAGTSGVGGASGAGGSDPGTDAGTDDAGTTEGGTGNPDCPSALRSQTRPEERFFCGSAGPNEAEGEATGLVNYQQYAVGVAARDRLGNPGLLYEIKCAMPQEVDDFYEVYKRAGGSGGGGFCSLGAEPASGAGLLLGVAALAHWVRRRRRR